MKKTISLILLLLSVMILWKYSLYTKGVFNYNTAQFIGYLFYWSVALFLVSIFALALDNRKYKIFSISTLVFVLVSLLIAYNTGQGSGAILSFDGKDLTLILSGLYSSISIIYFIIQFFKKRKIKN